MTTQTSASSIRIATAQTVIRNERPRASGDGDHPFPAIAANLADITAKAREAAAAGADVLVLPEFCAQGIAADLWYLAWLDRAIFAYLCVLSSETGVALCGSLLTGEVPDFIPRVPCASPFDNGADAEGGQCAWLAWLNDYEATKPDEFHPVVKNTAFYIDEGGVRATYDKRNLWHPEREYVSPGDSFCTAFDTKWGRAGMMICWDLSHSSAAQALSDQSVTLVFVPAYWLATDPEPWLSKHQHEADYERKLVQSWMFGRAVETESVWVLSNVAGDEAKGFMGGSGVWAPLRGRVAGIERAGEGLAFAEVDLAVLRDGREAYKIREDFGKCKL